MHAGPNRLAAGPERDARLDRGRCRVPHPSAVSSRKGGRPTNLNLQFAENPRAPALLNFLTDFHTGYRSSSLASRATVRLSPTASAGVNRASRSKQSQFVLISLPALCSCPPGPIHTCCLLPGVLDYRLCGHPPHAAEDRLDRPAALGVREEDFARAPGFGTVVPALEQRQMALAKSWRGRAGG